LITALLAAEENGERLTPELVLGTVVMLLFAGYEPTMHQIGNGMLALLRHPDQAALLRDAPALLPQAVDELLRYDSSVQMTFRYALEEVELGGKQLRTGDHVAIVFGSALRDPTFFNNPDTLDVTRPTSKTVTFGLGPHYCLGAALARTEGEVAIGTLLRRFPTLRLASTKLTWQETAAVRGLTALPVEVS
jgi:cytochrome P450